MLTQLKRQVFSKARSFVTAAADRASSSFNGLSVTGKKAVLLIFGVVMGGISFMLIMQALRDQEDKKSLSIESISTPKDIYMKQKVETMTDDELIPVGKLKGEINGEFEAFYLAVDREGRTYMNRSIDFSRDAYHRSKGWEEISREDLARYEKELHFFPARSKGLKP